MRAIQQLVCTAMVFALFVMSVQPADAQEASEAESSSVVNRPRLSLDPQGFDIGSFRGLASLATSVGYNDNIYSRATPQIGDGEVRFQPAIDIRSLWKRNALSLRADADVERFFSRSSENSSQYGLQLNGRYDFTPDYRFSYSANLSRDIEQRGTAGDVLLPGGPNVFWTKAASARFSATPGHFLIEVSGHSADFHYVDVKVPGGKIDLSQRDYVSYGGQARVGYEIGSNIYAFTQGSLNRSRYLRDASSGRDSTGYGLSGGVQLSIGPLIGGSLSVGYIAADFSSPEFSDVHGLSYNGSIFWNPTQLLSLRFSADRSVQRAPITDAAGIDQSQVSVTADYELLRRLILTGTVGLVRSDFRGIARRETRYFETLSARYNLNRFVDLTASVQLRQQNSTLSDRDYTGNSFRVGAIARY